MIRHSYLSPKAEVKRSPIHGKGLFARRPIQANQIVAVKGGHVLERTAWREIEKELGAAEIQLTKDLFIAPVSADERDGAMLYLNHSCEPNCAIQGQIVFVAMRDIREGEEVTIDWATTDDDDYEMICNCGAASCRGIVTGKDWQRPELRRKYAGWFAWHLQCRIDRESIPDG